MIDTLKKIEKEQLLGLLHKPEIWKTLLINYHPPIVHRLYTDIGEHRLFLHFIEPCSMEDALWHPHPWPSAIHVVDGDYEMGVGYGPGETLVKEVCKLNLTGGSYYEMMDPDGWHYVRPVSELCKSIMITGKPWERWSPKSEEKLGPLTEEMKLEILAYFRQVYTTLINKLK